MTFVEQKVKESFQVFKKEGLYKNPFVSPRLVKVVVNAGVGSIKDKKKLEMIGDRLMKITGQKPSARGARISIANFKVRQGDNIGYQVTLRGKRMMDFLENLIHIAFPRSKDFRGLSLGSLDEAGNLTIGIKEHIIFPETSDEDIKDIFGLAVTIVTTAKRKEDAQRFLEHLGFPFKKKQS